MRLVLGKRGLVTRLFARGGAAEPSATAAVDSRQTLAWPRQESMHQGRHRTAEDVHQWLEQECRATERLADHDDTQGVWSDEAALVDRYAYGHGDGPRGRTPV
jgi:hypothetical protein